MLAHDLSILTNVNPVFSYSLNANNTNACNDCHISVKTASKNSDFDNNLICYTFLDKELSGRSILKHSLP